MMWGAFTFGGVTSTDYGVQISGESVFSSPEREYDFVQIPGRNGDLTIDRGRYSNIEVTYPGFIVDSFTSNIEGLRSALGSKRGYQRLTDTYHPDEYRLGVFTGGVNPEPILSNTAAEFNISFNCKPQRFLTSGEGAQTFSASGTITNPTQFEARPLVVVNGLGSVGIGDVTITLTGSAAVPVYIDCDIMDAWIMSGSAKVPYNNYVAYSRNKAPALPAGETGISLGSGVSSISITPRWWRL